MTALIEISALTICSGNHTITPLLNLTLQAGRPLTILGETGSGKSLLAQAILGNLPAGLISEGSIRIHGNEMSVSQRQALWGRQMTMLPQEPAQALDPTMRAQPQVSEVHRLVTGLSSQVSREKAQQSLTRLDLQQDGHKLPGQLSGGMAQRLAFSAATAAGAQILLADEPTKGLDLRHRNDVISLLRQHIDQNSAECPCGLLTITHDVEVARQLGGDIVVMRHGEILEAGDATQVLNQPRSGYARELIQAVAANCAPQQRPLAAANDGEPLLTLHNCHMQRGNRQLFQGLELTLKRGEIVGLCGDSGSGKSTLGDILLGLIKADKSTLNWLQPVSRQQKLKLYQDPPAAFADNVPLGRLLMDVIRLHGIDSKRLGPLMESLRLSPDLLQRPAGKVSGGELQRIALLRVLLMKPGLLVADEPTSRLDPVTARDVTLLMTKALRESECTTVLISHDEHQLHQSCDRVLRLSEGILNPVEAVQNSVSAEF